MSNYLAVMRTKRMATLMVVDDEPSICWGLKRTGEALGHQVVTFSSAEAGLEAFRGESPDVLFLDIRLPGMDGLEAMPQFQKLSPEIPVIVMTAYGDLETAVVAVRQGAFEYLVKPFNVERIREVLQRALRPAQPRMQGAEPVQIGGMVGTSPPMQAAFQQIALAAATDINVLILGESGTGKELAARAIHRYSQREQGPFVVVNVAALNPSLAESELFGHARGAFTGADSERVGLLSQAQGGTLFLDEVADIPLPLQVKLLRALEYREIVPVGGSRREVGNFRILSATHQDLLSKVQEGSFRHDLYFRLAAFELHMPPLRDCSDDIPDLARFFLSGFTQKRQPMEISEEAMAEMMGRLWLGNVRELRNVIEHAATVARGGVIELEHIPPPASIHGGEHPRRGDDEELLVAAITRWVARQIKEEADLQDLYPRFLKLVEPPLLETVWRHHQKQFATAARALGIHRTTLRKKLEELGIVGDEASDS